MTHRRATSPRAGLAASAALCVAMLAPEARAQIAGAGTITISRVTRHDSPRASETIGGLLNTDPIGIRDCSCESWRFEGNYAGLPTTTLDIEYWVGTTATACSLAINRMPGLSTTTCWQIPTTVHPSEPVGTGLFNVDIPSRWLVDPINGTCQPVNSSVSTEGTMYFSIIARPPDDNTPIATSPVPFNVTVPIAPDSVNATSGEQLASVSWNIGAVLDTDSGLTTVPANIRGFYILCLPHGNSTTVVDGGSSCDGSLPDIVNTDVIDADVDTSDASLDAATSMDGGTEAGVDASTTADASTEAGDAIDEGASAMCTVNAFPADFNPSDEAQFQQYRCSELLDRTAVSQTITGLTNGTGYRFAVISQDNAGNRSVLSTLSPCVQPQLVTDFWELYEMQAGSRAARPGFCSAPATRGASSGRGAGVSLLAALGAVLLVRRKRSPRGPR